MVQKKKKKKYKLNARFYVWIIGLGIISCTTFQMVTAFQNNAVPNFHGWSAEKVMAYDAAHESIAISYELVYSYDVLHNRVLSQSVKPSTRYGDEPIEVVIQVSKGYPIMADFTGKSLDELLAFAKAYDIKVTQHAMTSPATNQTLQQESSDLEEPINPDQSNEDFADEGLMDGQVQGEEESNQQQAQDENTTMDVGEELSEGLLGDEADNTQDAEGELEEEPVVVEKQRKVMTQTIPPGSTLLKGSVIEITFSIE